MNLWPACSTFVCLIGEKEHKKEREKETERDRGLPHGAGD